MFVNNNLGALNLGFPDVCKVPMVPVPVPMPFPNLALSTMAVPTQFTVFVMCMPAHNMTTTIAMSDGDEVGILGGVVSQLDMGPSRCFLGSFNLFVGGPPATKMTAPTGQNGVVPNAPGAVISPAQTVLLSLR
ncbi:MAG: DUF4150 domain-containing protein [Methylovirgula sp.]